MELELLKRYLKEKKDEIVNLRSTSYQDEPFLQWKTSLDNVIFEEFGENSKEYKNFRSIQFHILAFRLPGRHLETPVDQNQFLDGLKKAEIFLCGLLEKINLYGISDKKNNSDKVDKLISSDKNFVQNIYLTQTQIQNISQKINLENLDQETKAKIEELFDELGNKTNQNKVKIGNIVKWLADRAIDVLIAILTQPK